MLFKQRLIIVVIALLIIFSCVLWFAYRSASVPMQRDVSVLLNSYFKLKKSNPRAARQALDILLQQNASYTPALVELSQWLIHDEQFAKAIPVLQKLRQKLPKEKIYQLQLAYAYYQTGEWAQAKHSLAPLLSDKETSIWKVKAEEMLQAMNSFIPNHRDWVRADFFNTASTAYIDRTSVAFQLNQFYKLRREDKRKARACIDSLYQKYPNHAQVLRESGVLAIEEKRLSDALDKFLRIYAITGDATDAMQVAYLYSGLEQNKLAYTYFERATHTKNQSLSLLAEDAMTRLAGQQVKAMPKPYYGEFYFMPFTQNRFGITVSQFIGRLGLEFDLPTAPRVYSFTRRTQDNRENNFGELTQLYEDNVWVTGMGLNFFPLKKFHCLSMLKVARHTIYFIELAGGGVRIYGQVLCITKKPEQCHHITQR